MLLFAFFIVFYPVARSFLPKKEQAPGPLQDLLSSERGLKFFELYVATELSLENILFYRSVKAWKRSFHDNARDTQRTAEIIADTYLTNNADLEVNISFTLKSATVKAIRQGEVALETLDACLDEVTRLMVTSRNNRVKRLLIQLLLCRQTSHTPPSFALTFTSSTSERLNQRRPCGLQQLGFLLTHS